MMNWVSELSPGYQYRHKPSVLRTVTRISEADAPKDVGVNTYLIHGRSQENAEDIHPAQILVKTLTRPLPPLCLQPPCIMKAETHHRHGLWAD